MQPLRAHQLAHEAEEDPGMIESTTDIRIVPLPTGHEVLTEVLRDGARRLLAEAIEAEVAAWIDAHAHLKDDARRRGLHPRPSLHKLIPLLYLCRPELFLAAPQQRN